MFKKANSLFYFNGYKLIHYSPRGRELEIEEGGDQTVSYEVHHSYLQKAQVCETTTRYDKKKQCD